ncbi:hypothetical protein ACFPRG_27710 [Deinococcus cellulosilyticus]
MISALNHKTERQHVSKAEVAPTAKLWLMLASSFLILLSIPSICG